MSKHRIVLEFENEQTLGDALEHIGDSDAPVMIIDGHVETAGSIFTLWSDFDEARKAIVTQQDSATGQ